MSLVASVHTASNVKIVQSKLWRNTAMLVSSGECYCRWLK